MEDERLKVARADELKARLAMEQAASNAETALALAKMRHEEHRIALRRLADVLHTANKTEATK